MGDRDVSESSSETSDGEESEVSESSEEFSVEEYRSQRRASFEAKQKVAYERAIQRKNALNAKRKSSTTSVSSDEGDESAGSSGTGSSSGTTKDGSKRRLSKSRRSSTVKGKLRWAEEMQKKGAKIPPELFTQTMNMKKPEKVSAVKQPEEAVVQSQTTPELNFVASSPEENDTRPPDHFLTSTPFVGHLPSSQAEVSFSPVVNSSKKNNLIFTSKKAIERVPARSQDDSKQNSQPVKAATSKSNKVGTINVTVTDVGPPDHFLTSTPFVGHLPSSQAEVSFSPVVNSSKKNNLIFTSKKALERVPARSQDDSKQNSQPVRAATSKSNKDGTFNVTVTDVFKGKALRRSDAPNQKENEQPSVPPPSLPGPSSRASAVQPSTSKKSLPRQTVSSDSEDEVRESDISDEVLKQKNTFNVSNAFKGNALRRTNIEEERSVFAKTQSSETSEDEAENPPEVEGQEVRRKSTLNVSNPFKGKTLRRTNLEEDKSVFAKTRTSSKTSESSSSEEVENTPGDDRKGVKSKSTINVSNPFKGKGGLRHSNVPAKDKPKTSMDMASDVPTPRSRTSVGNKKPERSSKRYSIATGRRDSSLSTPFPASFNVSRMSQEPMRIGPSTQKQHGDSFFAKLADLSGDENEVEEEPVPIPVRNLSESFEVLESSLVEEEPAVIVPPVPKPRKRNMTMVTQTNESEPKKTSEKIISAAAPVDIASVPGPSVVDIAVVNALPVPDTHRGTRARGEMNGAEAPKQKGTVEVVEKQSKKMQKQPATKLRKGGPPTEDDLQERVPSGVDDAQENAALVVGDIEENDQVIVSPVIATRRATRARGEKDRVESPKQKETAEVTKQSSKKLQKQPALKLPERNRRGTTAEADLQENVQENAAPVDVQEDASPVVDDFEENPTPIVDDAEVNASPVAATRRATRARGEKNGAEEPKQKGTVEVVQKNSKKVQKQPASKLRKGGPPNEDDLQESAPSGVDDPQENAALVVGDIEANDEVIVSPVVTTRRPTRARVEKDRVESSKQKEAVEVTKQSSKKLQKQPALKLPKRNKRGPIAEDDFQEDAAPVAVEENALLVVDDLEENQTPIVDDAEVNASPVAATRRATRARGEKNGAEESKQKGTVEVVQKNSKKVQKQPASKLRKGGRPTEDDPQESAPSGVDDAQENAALVVGDIEANDEVIVSPVVTTRRAKRARGEKKVESAKYKETVEVTKKSSKQLQKQPALKLPERNRRGTTAEADLQENVQENAAPVIENASLVVDDIEENPTPIVDDAEVNASPVAANRRVKRARGEKDGPEPKKQKEAVVKKSSKKLQKQPSMKLSKRGLPAEDDVDENASPPDEGAGTEAILTDDEPGPSTSGTQKRKQSAMTAADDNSKVSKRLRISTIEERLAVPGSKKPSSQTSMSSTRPATYSKRPSIFSKGPSGSNKKVAGRKNPNPPERYVGNDVFGNYHMLEHNDFKKMMASIHPDLELPREVMEGIELKLNHFLEDFFTHHCEQSRLPYGVISFRELKTALIDQCLIDEDASDNKFIKLMKRHMSKEEFKNCEGMLYPKPGATDTIDFVYQ